MAVDMFIKIGPIKGESKDTKHAGEIDVLAWSWGMSQSGSTHGGSGSGAGKVNVQDLSFTHYIDMSSAELMNAVAQGTHFDDATLVVRKAGGKDALEYLTIKMENVIVTSVSTGGSGGEDRLTENVSLNFGIVNVDYKEQTEQGASGAAPHFGYDIAANTEV